MTYRFPVICSSLVLLIGASLSHAQFTMFTSNPPGGATISSAYGHGIANVALTALDAGLQSAPVFVGSSIDSSYRYASIVAADSEPGDAFHSDGVHSNQWSFVFTVNAPVGYTYDVVIQSRLKGVHVLAIDDFPFGGGPVSYTNLSNVTGQLDFVNDPNLSLNTASSQSGDNPPHQTPIDVSNVFTLTGLTGTNSHHVNFSWYNDVYAAPGGA